MDYKELTAHELVQIKTLNSGVNVQPFWGDIESYEIGITRSDLDLNSIVLLGL